MSVDTEQVQPLPWPSYREYFSVLKTTAANITVLCCICKKEYSTSKTSSSNLRKHLEVSFIFIGIRVSGLGFRMSISLDILNYADPVEMSALNLNFCCTQKKHPTALKEFDSKKRKAEHGPTAGEKKRHAGGSSTQTLESCLAAASRPKALSQSRIDRLIVNFVVADMQCFSVVENEQFRCLINALQPSAAVMNRKSLVNQIDILYKEHKASLIATLEKASTVCCTADCWTASNR